MISATNTGTANLFFNDVAESGSFGLEHTIVNDGCIGLTITPGWSCQTLPQIFRTMGNDRPL